MVPPRIVLDTNVLVAGLRSRRGSSFRLLSMVGAARFEVVVSVPLLLEYEAALLEHLDETPITRSGIDDVLDYLCRIAHRQDIFFLWRPLLRDPKDDLVLEAAVAGGCSVIVTYNIRDFVGAERFGLRVLRPPEFLEEVKNGL
jgi:putative PIN family toxin of toxin-antitoxin system